MAKNLNFKGAITQCVELFNIQAERDHQLIEEAHDAATLQAAQDHANIQAMIDTANDQISITDQEILSLFTEDVQKKYKHNHTDEYNFKTEPDMLLTILNNSDTFTTTFTDYQSALEGDEISLTKDNSDSYTFTIGTNKIEAIGEVNNDNYKVLYVEETVTKLDS